MSKIKNNLRAAKTVGELMEELSHLDPELPVVFSYQSGDHWRTIVAQQIDDVSITQVGWSDYHEKPTPLDFDGIEKSKDFVEAVVLS